MRRDSWKPILPGAAGWSSFCASGTVSNGRKSPDWTEAVSCVIRDSGSAVISSPEMRAHCKLLIMDEAMIDQVRIALRGDF